MYKCTSLTQEILICFFIFDTCSMYIFLFLCEILRHLQFFSRRISRPHKADEVYRSTSEWLHKQVYGSHLPIWWTTEGPSIELEWYSYFIITYITWIFENFSPILWNTKEEFYYVTLFNFEISILKFSFIFWSISDCVTFNF